MKNEFKLKKDLIVSYQFGYHGRRSTFNLSPALLIVIISALLCLSSLGFLYLGILRPHSKMKKQLTLLQTENHELREKLDIYSAALDSLAVYMQIDLNKINSPATTSGQNYPYIDTDKEQDTAFVYDEFLNTRIRQIERNLNLLLSSLPDSSSTHQHNHSIIYSDSGNGIPSIYPTFGRISDTWGMRIHPIFRRLAFHYGIDFANNPGTPIYATAPGRVIYTGYESDYGKMIKIEHDESYESRYGHLYNFQVREGDVVKRGQIIGLMGNTGSSTGPHLHYEVLVSGTKVNPSGYLNRLDHQLYVKK